MAAGPKSDLVVFQKQTFATNAFGQNIGTWGTGFDAWAEVQRQSQQNCRFIIWYRLDLTPAEIANMPKTHRIVFEGKLFNITNALADRKRKELTIDSDFSALVEATDLLSTAREYVDSIAVVRPPES